MFPGTEVKELLEMAVLVAVYFPVAVVGMLASAAMVVLADPNKADTLAGVMKEWRAKSAMLVVVLAVLVIAATMGDLNKTMAFLAGLSGDQMLAQMKAKALKRVNGGGK